MATEKGIVKKTVLSAYGKPRKGGIYAIEIRDGDKLIEARVSNGEHDILLGTYEGKSIRFSEKDIRPSGRKTMGVKGIKLGSAEPNFIPLTPIVFLPLGLISFSEKRIDFPSYVPSKMSCSPLETLASINLSPSLISIA